MIITLSEYDFGTDATAGIMFRASGATMTHYDGFRQVAFHGPDAVGPFHVLLMQDGDEESGDAEPHERPWTGPDGRQYDTLFEAMDAAEAMD